MDDRPACFPSCAGKGLCRRVIIRRGAVLVCAPTATGEPQRKLVLHVIQGLNLGRPEPDSFPTLRREPLATACLFWRGVS